MQAEVKTRARITRSGDAEVILQVSMLPRGSGNRNKCRRLAAEFRQMPRLKGHVKKVVAGASSVTVHLRASVELMQIITEMVEERRMKDVPGQLPLFGT